MSIRKRPSSTRPTKRRRSTKPRIIPKLHLNVVPSRRITTEIKTFDYNYLNANSYEIPLFSSMAGANAFLTGNATGGMTCINAIVLGNSALTRIGNKITIKSIRMRILIYCTTPTTNSIRVCLLVDRQPNQAFPTIDQIFQDSTTNTDFNSSLNMGYKDRFRILRETVYSFTNNGNLGRYVSKMSRKRIPCMYITSDGDIGDLGSNSILLLIGSSNYTNTSNFFTVRFTTRIRYYDF